MNDEVISFPNNYPECWCTLGKFPGGVVVEATGWTGMEEDKYVVTIFPDCPYHGKAVRTDLSGFSLGS